MRRKPQTTSRTITNNDNTQKFGAIAKVDDVETMRKHTKEPSIERGGVCDAKTIINMNRHEKNQGGTIKRHGNRQIWRGIPSTEENSMITITAGHTEIQEQGAEQGIELECQLPKPIKSHLNLQDIAHLLHWPTCKGWQ